VDAKEIGVKEMKTLDTLQTMSLTFQEICQGERPWTALGNFMNYWYAYAKDQREALVADPLPYYDEQNKEHHQWATFCAASVVWFCKEYHIPCPAWALAPKYTLVSPWYFYSRVRSTRLEKYLRETTPVEFASRNVYCGDNCYANKWELVEDLPRMSSQSLKA
jgi:hypothetical protein